MVGVRVGANVRRLRQPLVDLLRRHRGRSGVALLRAGEAPEDLTDSDLRLVTELFDLGLHSALRSDEGNEVSVSSPIGNGTERDDGFGTLLQSAMAANGDKLRAACSKASMCCGSCSATTTPSGPTACAEPWQATVAGISCGTLLANLP
jgi:hypothetical protein